MREIREAPDEVAVKMTNIYEVDYYGVLTNSFDEDPSTEIYIREGIHKATAAEVQKLRAALQRIDELSHYHAESTLYGEDALRDALKKARDIARAVLEADND